MDIVSSSGQTLKGAPAVSILPQAKQLEECQKLNMDVFVLSNEAGIVAENLGQTVKAMHKSFVQQAYDDLNNLYVNQGKRFSSSHWHWHIYSRMINCNVID